MTSCCSRWDLKDHVSSCSSKIVNVFLSIKSEKKNYISSRVCLQLSEKVQRKNKRVKIIKLPKTEMKIKEKHNCVVAGWGISTPGGTSVTPELQKVKVRYMNLDECRKRWHPMVLPDTVLCAGGFTPDGKGACQVKTLLIDRKCNSDAERTAVMNESSDPPPHRATLVAPSCATGSLSALCPLTRRETVLILTTPTSTPTC